MALTIADLFATPDHYLHSFEGDAAICMPMDRAAYHRSIFLDRRISTAGSGQMRIPAAALAGPAPPPAPTAWIFHMAHCGSTLLARSLDDAHGSLVLREPLALRQLALAPDAHRLRVAAAMLGKRYRVDAPTLVKANVPVNFILPDLIDLDPNARAIFLHSTLDDYLLAILRDDNHRAWLRNVTAQLAAHIGDLSALRDAECAAALWMAQRQAFATALARMPNARTLEAEVFFTAPAQTLKAAARLLEVPLADAAIDATVDGPLFKTYSKNPAVTFDNAARLTRRDGLRAPLAAELDQALHWIERTTGGRAHADVAIAAARL